MLGRAAEVEEDFTMEQRFGVQILEDRLYPHKTIRFNYTTYDMRREQDCIAPHRHPDIMVRAPDWDGTHPFWFARVLGIIHVNACYVGPGSTHLTEKWRRVDLLWVRWFT